MACYYCVETGRMNTDGVGICKICNTEACSPNQETHGEKCFECEVFFCHHHQDGHLHDKWNVFELFPKSTHKIPITIIDELQKLSDDNKYFVADLGIYFSDKLGDQKLKNSFMHIMEPKLDMFFEDIFEPGQLIEEFMKKMNEKGLGMQSDENAGVSL